jgi:proteasome lid subunit RPN8/RPN11
LSYVRIWKPVSDRIAQAPRNSDNEIIGPLLGRLENDTLIIEDSVTGEFQAEPNRVALPSNTLAKIADDMLNRRTKGNTIGWYHSHMESGLVFSETVVQTQTKLEQFSSLTAAMVVDAKTGGVGYFRVDAQTGKPSRILDAHIRVFQQSAEAIGPDMKTESQIPRASTFKILHPSSGHTAWRSAKTNAICHVLAVAAALAVLRLIFNRSLSALTGIEVLHHGIIQLTVR